MGERVKYRERRPRHLAPESRMRIERVRADGAVFALVLCVAEARRVSIRELLQGGQNRGHVGLSRQIAIYLAHVVLGRKLEEIATLFSRSPGSVFYACRNVEMLRDRRAFEVELALIEARIQQAARIEFRHVA